MYITKVHKLTVCLFVFDQKRGTAGVQATMVSIQNGATCNKLHDLLKKLYPNVYTSVNQAGILTSISPVSFS